MNSPALPASRPDRAAAVWAALGQIFGRKFFAEFGDSPNAMWRREVDGLADAQISHGLERLRKEAREFAPSLGQFVSLCRDTGGSPRMLGQNLDDATVLRLSGPASPGQEGLPGGMSQIVYTWARDKRLGKYPDMGDPWIGWAAGLPERQHEAYRRGDYRNAREHRAYLSAHPDYLESMRGEYQHRWGKPAEFLNPKNWTEL